MLIVTGGAGFIGSALISKLNALSHTDLLVVDNLNSPLKEKNLGGKKYTDYLDKKDFLQKLPGILKDKKVDAIFHMGACSSTIETNRDYMMSNNFEYSKTLLEHVLPYNIHFIYASSAAVYGNGELGFSDDDSLTPNFKPLNLYATSKLLFDQWVLEKKLENKVVGIRFFNVFGPNEYHKGEMRSVVLKAYEQIKRGETVKLFKSQNPHYADGEQKRDFVYIKDCTDVLCNLLEKRNVSGIFNLGTGKARSWNDLVNAIFSALGLPPKIEYVPMPEHLAPKYQYFTQADLQKLLSAGAAVEFSNLEATVEDYVKDYLEKDFACL